MKKKNSNNNNNNKKIKKKPNTSIKSTKIKQEIKKLNNYTNTDTNTNTNTKKEILNEKNKQTTEKGEDYLYVGEINKNGEKNGKGKIYFKDGSLIEGQWVNGELNGKGEFIDTDIILKGTFIDGELSGNVIESDRETGVITFRGEYKQGERNGHGVLYMEDGGEITGNWSNGGKMNGYAEYIFPGCNGRFKIEGKWVDGDLVQGKYKINYYPLKDELTNQRIPITDKDREYMKLLESYCKDTSKEIKEFKLSYDPSNDKSISSNPLIPDLFERFHCYVKKSNIVNSGEGLFARIVIPANTVMSFYNGIRLSHDLVNSRDWEHNSNTISLDIDTVIDVPPHFNDCINQYQSTISHKANHCVPGNNAIYSNFYHPRFGHIKCIKSIVEIQPDQEILVDYGYSDNDIPNWYKINN